MDILWPMRLRFSGFLFVSTIWTGDVRDVHDDLHLLAEYDIIHFEEDGRAKKPYVSYDTIRIEVEFGFPRRGGLRVGCIDLILASGVEYSLPEVAF